MLRQLPRLAETFSLPDTCRVGFGYALIDIGESYYNYDAGDIIDTTTLRCLLNNDPVLLCLMLPMSSASYRQCFLTACLAPARAAVPIHSTSTIS